MTNTESSGRKEPKRKSSPHESSAPKRGESRDLDAEIVRDLEPEHQAEDVRGGWCADSCGLYTKHQK
jgi:hypothetical protein